MKTPVFDTLKRLDLTSYDTRKLYNKNTRDISDLKVWRDEVSGVIYIDDFYTGDETYITGDYTAEMRSPAQSQITDFEENMDANRRFSENLRFVSDKKVVDFGCGRGNFLRLIKPYCKEVLGVELERSNVTELNSDGIGCVTSLAEITQHSIDVFVSFHVIEHLPNPLEILHEIMGKIKSGGTLLIEVPHANDCLLSVVPSEEFKQFTMWSQHLILHTRESLRRLLSFSGFEYINISGVQRYPLSNHLNWLANGKPGGHKSLISQIDTPDLNRAYEASLARIDATDTLVAFCRAP